MSKPATSARLIFQVRAPGDAHPTFEVVATGTGASLEMDCQCIARKHGALLCPHIVAVVREDVELVMYGKDGFDDLQARLVGSAIADKTNGYWEFYPDPSS